MCEEFGSADSTRKCSCTCSCTCSGDWASLVVCASLIQFDDINNYLWMLACLWVHYYKNFIKHAI